MSNTHPYRVVIAADPATPEERRHPHCVVYVEATSPEAAQEVALEQAQVAWSRFSVGPVPTCFVPTEGFRVATCKPLGADELYAYRNHRQDFEVTDRWRLRRGFDMHEGGVPWWVEMGRLHTQLETLMGELEQARRER